MALILRVYWRRTYFFPLALEISKERGSFIMKKLVKQIFLVMAIVVGVSITASAQSNDKKPPPKEKPPVIIIKDKDKEKPKDEKPKDEKKKPEMALLGVSRDTHISFV